MRIKNRQNILVIAFLSLVFALTACAQEEEENLSCRITTMPNNGATVQANESGYSQRIYISTDNDLCAWAAISDSDWLEYDPDSGLGNGYVTVTIKANHAAKPRKGTITFSGTGGKAASTVTFTQEASYETSCNFTISTDRAPFVDYSGGTGSISIKAQSSNCRWTAYSSIYWIAISSGLSGKGDGTVYYNVLVNNASDSRRGTINVAGKTITIYQQGRPQQPTGPAGQQKLKRF
jgi:hypothetical protein